MRRRRRGRNAVLQRPLLLPHPLLLCVQLLALLLERLALRHEAPVLLRELLVESLHGELVFGFLALAAHRENLLELLESLIELLLAHLRLVHLLLGGLGVDGSRHRRRLAGQRVPLGTLHLGLRVASGHRTRPRRVQN